MAVGKIKKNSCILAQTSSACFNSFRPYIWGSFWGRPAHYFLAEKWSSPLPWCLFGCFKSFWCLCQPRNTEGSRKLVRRGHMATHPMQPMMPHSSNRATPRCLFHLECCAAGRMQHAHCRLSSFLSCPTPELSCTWWKGHHQHPTAIVTVLN